MPDDEIVLQEHNPGDEDRPAWTPIPEGTKLVASVEGVERRVMPFKDDDDNEIVKWEFTFEVVEDGEFYGRRVQGQTPTTFTTHPDCKLRNWVTEILATDLPAGFKLSFPMLNGSLVNVFMKTKEAPRRDGKGMWIRNWVDDVQRYVEDPSLVLAPSATMDDDEPF